MAAHEWAAPDEPPGPLGESREQVLRLLRAAAAPLGVREVAARTGLHPNTARFHLVRLAAAGLAERSVSGHDGPGRPRLVYRAVAGPEHGQRSYRLLATMLASLVTAMLPGPAAAALAAGREWGRYLTDRPAPLQRIGAGAAAARLAEILTGLGFGAALTAGPPAAAAAGHAGPPGPPGPAGAPGELVIQLTHCPFREVAEGNQDVVCSLHLGLMQGVLAELRAPLTAGPLEPFAGPQLCLAHLRPAGGER